MSDLAHKEHIEATRIGIEQRVKLECKREQQEILLLSVIPAYIAAEVHDIFKLIAECVKTFYISGET